MLPSNPKLTVIIPCRNEADCIEDCLQSVVTQKSPGREVEVIVADGMSDDGTREILEQFAGQHAGMRIVDNPRRIASTGLNAAIALATGDIIVRLDAHTEYAPDYLQQCRVVLQQTGADNVGGPARTRPRTFWERAIAAAYHSGFAAGGARFHNEDYEGYVDTVTYGCWRKATFDRFGLFDEELVRNQDDEHNLRIIRGGGKVWQSPRIRSYYRPRGSLAALFQQYSQYGYWKVRVIRKHRLPASPRHLVPGAFVLSLRGFCFSRCRPEKQLGTAARASLCFCLLPPSLWLRLSSRHTARVGAVEENLQFIYPIDPGEFPSK